MIGLTSPLTKAEAYTGRENHVCKVDIVRIRVAIKRADGEISSLACIKSVMLTASLAWQRGGVGQRLQKQMQNFMLIHLSGLLRESTETC